MRSRADRLDSRTKRKRREKLLYRYYSHPRCPVVLKNRSVKEAWAAYRAAVVAKLPNAEELYASYEEEFDRVYGKAENCHFTRRPGKSPKEFKRITSGRIRAKMRNLSPESDVSVNGNVDRKRELDWPWTID